MEMNKPVLVIMAAGMGSRYGGLKQIDKVTDQGEIIIDFSLYDGLMAGFEKVIFIIKEEMEDDFRALIDQGAGKRYQVEYVFQRLDDLPEGFSVPEGREKPWGTCHAVMSARHLINTPFAVINADDFYGAQAFQKMYEYLLKAEDDSKYRYSMVGYRLDQTLTEHGHVARGVCEIDDKGYLVDIEERLKIMWRGDKVSFTEDDANWTDVPEDSTVSMNFWGFTMSMMEQMISRFPAFLEKALKENPLKGEYLLPKTVDELVKEDLATVEVLKSDDRWFGVTYREDRQSVVDALQSMKDKGIYPEKLWR